VGAGRADRAGMHSSSWLLQASRPAGWCAAPGLHT
jgi:hypothetical protein